MPFTAEWLRLYREGKARIQVDRFMYGTRLPNRKAKTRLLEKQESSCCWCGHYMSIEQATWEHIIPRGLGGSDEIGNLALAHAQCNHERRTNVAKQPHPSKKFDFVRAVLAERYPTAVWKVL